MLYMKSLSSEVIHDKEDIAYDRVFFDTLKDRSDYTPEEVKLFAMRLTAYRVTAWSEDWMNFRGDIYNELMDIAEEYKRWFE